MKCGLIDTVEFTNDLNDLVHTLIKDTTNPKDKFSDKEIQAKFKTGLHILRNKYNQSDFDDSVKEYLADDIGLYDFGNYINEGFDYLKPLIDLDISEKINLEEQEKESKVDSFSNTVENMRKKDLKGQFLNKFFILNSNGKLFFQSRFKNDFIRKLFISENNGDPKLITNGKELNSSIYEYRKELKNTIENALREGFHSPSLAAGFKNISIIENALRYIEDEFSILSYDLLHKIPLLNTLPSNSEDRLKLEGYLAFVALKNFDPMIKLTFGKAVSINNMNYYDIEDLEKYSITLGDNNTNTWRDESKDVDETEELGTLPVLFLESLKIYNENGDPTSQNLTFANVKTAIGNIYKLFNEQNTKLSSTIFTRTITPRIIEELTPIYGKEYVQKLVNDYVENKNFKQIIASAKEHPSELMPIVFRLLMPIKEKQDTIKVELNPIYGEFPKKGTKVKETITSLYHNLYNVNNKYSLINLTKNAKFNPNYNTMYDYVNTLFLNIENKDMLEYNSEEDGITITTLSAKNANSRLNSRTRTLDGKYHKSNILGTIINDNTTAFDNFTIEDNLKKDVPEINITVGDYNIKVGKDLKVRIFKGDQVITITESNIQDFLPFVSEVIEIPLVKRNEYTGDIDNYQVYDAYKNLGGSDLSLVNLASTILYNYTVGKNVQNVTNSNYEEKVSEFYSDSKTAPKKKMYKQFQPELITSSVYNAMEKASAALDVVDGYAEVNTVKDGEGKQISTLALSSLMSKVGEIWENHTKKQDSPANGFSIYSLYEGVEFIRDFAGLGEHKQGTAFTQAELAEASILYDMYGDLEEVTTSKDGKINFSPKSSGILRVMGPIIADKSNLPKLKFNWNSIVKVQRDGKLEDVKLRDLTVNDLKEVIYREFGDYYQKVYNNIENQYEIVNKYIGQAAQNLGILPPLTSDVRFNYKTNFREINTIYGKRTAELLHEAVYLAQQNGEYPELIDQIGYINDKGYIHNNPSLVHQLNLFGRGQGFEVSEGITGVNEEYNEYWNRKEVQLVTDFLQSGTVLRVRDGEVPLKGNAIAIALEHNKNFIHKENIAVVKIIEESEEKDPRYTKISQLSDFEHWYHYSKFKREKGEEFFKNNPQFDINAPNFNLELTLATMSNGETNFSYEINPEIVRHNLLDYYLSEEFVMSTTGTYVAHPAKETDIKRRESTQFGQAVKRYVSYTASKHREAAGNLNGIPNTLNVAIIEDYRDSGLTIGGEYDSANIKPFDGASFYNPTMQYLDNNSLGGDAMGVDKKPFAHQMGQKSGIGFILKTAGFALTNDRIRNSIATTPEGKIIRFYENLNKQMLNVSWSRYTSNQNIDWTVDYNDKSIQYGTWNDSIEKNVWYYNKDGHWFARYNPKVENGITYFDEVKVASNGEPINGTIKNQSYGIIDTNWKLWNFFGGMYSGHLVNGKLTYEQDNTSVQMLVKAMNNVGIKTVNSEQVLGQEGVNQVLKKAQVHIAATGGAVKYGGGNINSNKAYFNPDYHLTYMQVDTYDIGEQLDAEHHAEDGRVALMTQVVNALGARGYSEGLAQECYSALNTIAEITNQKGLEGLDRYNISGDPKDLQDALAGIIYKALTKVSDGDGNMLNALATTILETSKSNFDWSNIEGKFPISHPAIFKKIVSSVSSELEKGIRLKFEGNMFVLNPSNRVFTTINGHLSGYYKNHIEELVALEKANKFNPIQAYQIKIGYNYRTVDGRLFQVDNPQQYIELKNIIEGGGQVYETVLQETQLENGVVKIEPLGHDLAPYNAIFADIEGKYYNIWDLESVRQLWELHDVEETSEKAKLRAQLQRDLNALSEGVESVVKIIEFDKDSGEYVSKIIRVDKSKTKVSPYEIILPKMYKTEFGLNVDDDLNTIRNNQLFFVNRSVQNWKSKIRQRTDIFGEPLGNYNYDLELKVLNGNHIYLGLTPEEIDTDNLSKVDIETEIDGDTLYRVTPQGRRLYAIPYHLIDGKYIPDVQVYRTIDGEEIIYSNNLTHFLNEFSYNAVVIAGQENTSKEEILKQLNDSSNKSAKRKIDFITRIMNKRIKRKEDSIFKDLLSSTSLGENDKFADLFTSDVDYDFDSIIENEEYLEETLKFISNDATYYETQRKNFQNDLDRLIKINEREIKDLIKSNPLFKGMILSGIDTHTSFLQSLEAVVSRTPAQSQQSFMAMRVAAFAAEDTNSAYVSRMQFLLQGSDLDIDKISLLGLAFNHGKLITWSPYVNLKSAESFNISKRLPFPTGKKLEINYEPTKRPFDVLKNDLLVVTDNETGGTIISTVNGNSLILFGTEESENGYTIQCEGEFDNIPPMDKYTLLRNALSKIPIGKKVTLINFDINNAKTLGIDENGINQGTYDYLADFEEFNNALFPIRSRIDSKIIEDNIIDYAPNLDTLIRVYNKLGYATDANIAETVDHHNTYLNNKTKKRAAHNFIAIRTKDISASPINQIQAQAAIDEQIEKLRSVLSKPEYQKLVAQTQKADRGSVYSKFFLLTLTLAGKENVGIVASSLKNFEAISQYTYQVLNSGTEEEQKELLFNRVINGHRVRMIANSYARNMDTVKDENVKLALTEVDNVNDAYLALSALLSAATDNTKDPILPKLNAGPEMITLYNSGVMLGLSTEEIAKLALSKTGIILSNLTKGNVFNGKQGTGLLTQAIQYIQRPPSVSFSTDEYAQMAGIFQSLKLLDADLTKSSFDSIITNNYNRMTINRILKFLASPNENSSILKFDQKLFANTQIAQLKNSKEYRGFSKKRKELLDKLTEKKNNLNPEEKLNKEDQELYDKLDRFRISQAVVQEKIDELKNYRDNDTQLVTQELKEALESYQEATKEDGEIKKSIKTLRANLYTRSGFASKINQIIDWINTRDIVDFDFVEGEDGGRHKILNQIERLNEFTQELQALRPLMALNQGLENKLEDQLEFESKFGTIIKDRLDVIGSTNLEKYYKVEDLLKQLEEFNANLRNEGLILNPEKYYVDLNNFVYNPEYNKLVKDIYGKIKFATNIFRVVDGVDHYKAYLKLANLQNQMLKKGSVAYRTTKKIEDTIVSEMNVKKAKHIESIRKNIISTIYRRLNSEFIAKKNQSYVIPDFDIKDGRVDYKSEGKTYQLILNEEGSQKFKDWIQYIEFPKWKREYPNNKFIQLLGYRMYDYNKDHNQSINLAKTYQFNMKNPADVVEFDLCKSDLQKLPSNIIDKLFYYNIIAYNNQPGQLALTDMFEDLVAANNFELIRDYNTFISNHENVDIDIAENEKIKQEISPVLSVYEVKPSLNLPYIYVRNPENGITYLLQKSSGNEDYNSDMDMNIDENVLQGENKKDFFGIMDSANYIKLGGSTSENNLKEVIEAGNFVFTNAKKLSDIVVTYNNKEYSSKEILKKAKSKGITKLSEIFPRVGGKKYDAVQVEAILTQIFEETPKC